MIGGSSVFLREPPLILPGRGDCHAVRLARVRSEGGVKGARQARGDGLCATPAAKPKGREQVVFDTSMNGEKAANGCKSADLLHLTQGGDVSIIGNPLG